MGFRIRLLLLICGACTGIVGPRAGAQGLDKDTVVFRIVSYNVENLFDCRHDSLKDDYEFLPDAVRHWNYRKYRKKLDQVARAVVATGGGSLPALVALCEVENDSVMRDLTRYSALREARYRYIMTHSNDERGMDVALMYQRAMFKPIGWESIAVKKSARHKRPLRDLLHVTGLLLNLDTLDVFVVHFSSRSKGTKATEPYRLSAAETLKQAVDSIGSIRTNPQIVIMGDFNDYPTNRSIATVLAAELPPANAEALRTDGLYQLLARKALRKRRFWEFATYGSYKYKGEWGLLDHILVSGNLLHPSSALYTNEERCGVATLPFLLTTDSTYGGMQPFRTYHGMRYQGGFSDHLPVYAEFRLIY